MKKQNKLSGFLFAINTCLFLLVSSFAPLTACMPVDFVCPRKLHFQKKLKDNVLLFNAKRSNDETEQYVVKAYEYKDMAISDCIASQIAQTAEIPGIIVKQVPQDTYLITKSKVFTLDAFIDQWNKSRRNKFKPIITMHPYIEGKTLDKDNPFNICIKGLNESKHIKSIAHHEDLAKIVALGIFLSDEDCHSQNLLCQRQKENNAEVRYYDIDFDHSYGSAMAYFTEGWGRDLKGLTPAYFIENPKDAELLPEFLEGLGYANKSHQYLASLKPSSLSSQEKDGLTNVNTTLQKLKHYFPVETLSQRWLETAQSIGWKLNNEQKFVLTEMINANYTNVEKVSRELERLTQK